METKRDHSYGIIPIRRTDNGPEVLLVHQYGEYWGFPKGHGESGESGLDSAIRELAEETGIVDVDVDSTRSFEQSYMFTKQDVVYDKTVTYYVGYVTDPSVRLQEGELTDAKWYPLLDARNRLTYDDTKRMFDEVIDFVTKN